MPLISPLGNPAAPIWVLLEYPFGTDNAKGYLCSGGMGYALQKMIEESGIALSDCYFTARRPDTDNPLSISSIEARIMQYKPPLLVAVGEIAQHLLSECAPTVRATWQTQLNKQVGSLLSSDALIYPHYMLPIIPIESMMMDFAERNIACYLDFGKIREEYKYFKQHGVLQKLPERLLLHHEMDTEEILGYLQDLYFSTEKISVDIETIYPRKGSEFYKKHPGLPITICLASAPAWAMSFNPWRDSFKESVALWRALDKLFSEKILIGQNFFLFDSQFLGALGFAM